MGKTLSRKLDLNLLDLFDTVYRTRNLTQAGKTLGLSQPAMSHALARLREMYGDPLFVRQAKGVEPTPFAHTLIGPVMHALQILEQTLEKHCFDPATAHRIFRLAMTDIGEHTFLPTLINKLQKVAPHVRIESVATSTTTTELVQALSQGNIDLALGAIEPGVTSIRHNTLFSDHYVCVAHKDRLSRGTLSKEEFLRAKHVVPDVAGTIHSRLIEQFLERHGLENQALVRVTHFLALAEVISQTDLVAVMPRNLAVSMQKRWDVRYFVPPIAMPGYDVMLCWHQRQELEPGNIWLRELIATLFAKDEAQKTI